MSPHPDQARPVQPPTTPPESDESDDAELSIDELDQVAGGLPRSRRFEPVNEHPNIFRTDNATS